MFYHTLVLMKEIVSIFVVIKCTFVTFFVIIWKIRARSVCMYSNYCSATKFDVKFLICPDTPNKLNFKILISYSFEINLYTQHVKFYTLSTKVRWKILWQIFDSVKYLKEPHPPDQAFKYINCAINYISQKSYISYAYDIF